MKTYYSTSRSLAVSIRVSGHNMLIRFRDLGQYINQGVFCTNSEEIANALEAHPSFGFGFFLDGGKIEQPAPVEEVKHVYDAVYLVKRTQDAIRILVEKHGVEPGTIKNRQGAVDKAAELNIHFPNL